MKRTALWLPEHNKGARGWCAGMSVVNGHVEAVGIQGQEHDHSVS